MDPFDPSCTSFSGLAQEGGADPLPLVEECDHLLLLDAVDAGKPGATVIELAREQIPLFSGVRVSQHQLTPVCTNPHSSASSTNRPSSLKAVNH
jgi:hypothetical protein